MMYTTTTTRSATSTCTAARVAAVLDEFLGDVVALIARGIMTQARAVDWMRDLQDVLLLEAVERFQIKLTLPDGTERALDYEVSDDGRIGANDGSGGFSAHWLSPSTKVGLVVRWRTEAPNYAAARKLLQGRGWGPATMLDASGAPDRAIAKDGYGLRRRTVGPWPL